MLILAAGNVIMRSFCKGITMGDLSDTPSGSPASDRMQRKAPRYTIVATAELTDTTHAMKHSGRVTDLSRNGCYVDVMNTLPAGTLLNVKIICNEGTFVTEGKIVYVQERIGMGVAFLDPPKDQLEILDSWIAKLPPATST
jgi:hypothetical protein